MLVKYEKIMSIHKYLTYTGIQKIRGAKKV